MAISNVNVKDLALAHGWALILLSIPVPPTPLLERAVGYQRETEGRFLALWWEPCGDEAMVSDGLVSFTGHWPGYLTYVQHPCVYPHLAAYNLGSSEGEAEYHLVIDRQEETAFLLPSRQADRLLSMQWERAERQEIPQVLSLKDLEAVLQKIAQEWRAPSTAEVMARMKEDQAAVQALRDWLDNLATQAK